MFYMKMKDLKKLLENYDDDVEVLGITIDKSLVDDNEFVYVNTKDEKVIYRMTEYI